MITEAEIGVMHPAVKEQTGLLATTRNCKRKESLELLELDFRPLASELYRINFWGFFVFFFFSH